MNNLNISPFVKWAGGKRQLMDKIGEMVPIKYNRYFEPFVGGGAVLFNFQPTNAVINDLNKSLINCYRQIQQSPYELTKKIDVYDKKIKCIGKEYYLEIRDAYNNKLSNNEYDIELAAMLIFINKHCFNGLYRVNSRGLFNVPYNNSSRDSYNMDNILGISEYLKTITILDGDFEGACEEAKEGDFVFFDSPYAPINPTSFESYTKEGFDVESHRRLARLFEKLTKKGCYCMLTNHNTEFIRKLYNELDNAKKIRMKTVSVKRLINSDANNRVGEEIIIYNY